MVDWGDGHVIVIATLIPILIVMMSVIVLLVTIRGDGDKLKRSEEHVTLFVLGIV